ncbi:hypothetical protein LCGC14_1006070 [marine sediment metagenome]|uniref:Uncharacterized protein n=1 Tax=marine sediment metagenome TaxID=412755 RepID=A0A0F9R7R1_9ZZZZ
MLIFLLYKKSIKNEKMFREINLLVEVIVL